MAYKFSNISSNGILALLIKIDQPTNYLTYIPLLKFELIHKFPRHGIQTFYINAGARQKGWKKMITF